MTTTWRLRRLPGTVDEEIETDLLDVDPCTDAYNRFARGATVVIDDPDGAKVSKYPQATPIALDAKRDIDSSFVAPRLGGFVANPQTDEQTLELEILSYDHWLRRRKPTVSYTDTLISGILENLIKNFTPLTWNANLVTVVNDVQISRDWRGETVDAIVDQLSSRSAGEGFGANNAGEFFFREIETDEAPRDFTSPADYLDADFSDDIKSEVNRAVVHYEDSNGNAAAVAVQDRASQKELQEEINAPSPVVIEIEKDHPEISTKANAEQRARKYLGERSSIRTGRITTWEGFGIQPGQVTRVTIPEQDVDGEYVIAEVTYSWLKDETELVLAQNSEGVTDILVGLSDEIDRVDVKNIDPSAPIDEHLDTSSGGVFDVGGKLVSRKFGTSTFTHGINRSEWGINRDEHGVALTNTRIRSISEGKLPREYLNVIRDAWKGSAPIEASRLLIGSGDSSPSTTDTGLETPITNVTPTIRTPGSFVARFVGSFELDAEQDINEVGIDDGAQLMSRAITDQTLVADPEAALDVVLELEAQNHPDRQATLVSAGREALRDIAAANGPDVVAEVGYGTGEQDLSTDDSQLATEVISVPVDSFEDGSAGIVTVVSSVGDSQAVGEDLTELGQKNSVGTLLTYVTYSAFSKASGETLITNDEMKFNN